MTLNSFDLRSRFPRTRIYWRIELLRSVAVAFALMGVIGPVYGQDLQLREHVQDRINDHFGDALCLGPYRVSARNPAGDGNVCYWNCHPTTVPDTASNACVCGAQLVPAGTLGDGRLVCEHPGDPLSDRRAPYTASASDFLDLAQTRGFGRQSLAVPNYRSCSVDSRGIHFSPEPNDRDSRCVVTLLSGGQLADSWHLESLALTAIGGRVEWFTNPGHLPMTLVVYGDHPMTDVQVAFGQIVLVGPPGRHWSDALPR